MLIQCWAERDILGQEEDSLQLFSMQQTVGKEEKTEDSYANSFVTIGENLVTNRRQLLHMLQYVGKKRKQKIRMLIHSLLWGRI
jgi:hypothetical protein